MSLRAEFHGGPAHGKSFVIARNVVYVRVVESTTGKLDVLDLLEDTPRADEAVYVYRQTSGGFACRGAGAGQFGIYEPFPSIDGKHVRDNDAWRAAVDKVSNERGEVDGG